MENQSDLGDENIHLKQCRNCKIDYPAHLVSPYLSGKGRIDVCGICALQLSNEYHGINRTRFTGTIAESFRLEALEWRMNRKL